MSAKFLPIRIFNMYNRWRLLSKYCKKLSRKVTVAMIGSGKAAKYHLRVLGNIENVDVCCIVNRGSNKPESLMKSYGIKKYYNSLDLAISDSNFEAAIVCVSPSSTFSVSKTLMNRGICCLIEKPLGLNIKEAEKLNKYSNQSKLVNVVGYNRRFFSSVLTANKIINEFGLPYSIHIDCFEDIISLFNKYESSDIKKRFITNTTHGIDMLTLFGGEHVDVTGPRFSKFYNDIKSDFINIISFKSGQTGTLLSHWRSPSHWSLSLFGDDYRINIDLSNNDIEFYYRGFKQSVETFSNIYDKLFKAGVYLQDYYFLCSVIEGQINHEQLATTNQSLSNLILASDILESK